MTASAKRILVVQTAFIGDVILTLPLIQVLKESFDQAEVDVVVVPRAAEICRNHPAISRIIEYDKRGKDKGLGGFRHILSTIRERQYHVAVLPHRSLRSSFLAFRAGIPLRVGFRKGGGRILLTKSVTYDSAKHEIERNLSLLAGVGKSDFGKVLPKVYPSAADESAISAVVARIPPERRTKMIAVAPGTIWNTKRWLKERFSELIRMVVEKGYAVALVGGKEDAVLCAEITDAAQSGFVLNTAGTLSLLESAELIRRCVLTLSNDSAPMHLSVAAGTPVVAIFGATVPSFGFAPYGPRDSVIETLGLKCRPCSIHGGAKCPIGTFDCMVQITPDRVFSHMMGVLERSASAR